MASVINPTTTTTTANNNKNNKNKDDDDNDDDNENEIASNNNNNNIFFSPFVIKTAQQQQKNTEKSKILTLLIARERHGIIVSSSKSSRIRQTIPIWGLMRQPPRITAQDISSVVAWNPSRMQNAILAVGPGTPASTLLRPTPSSSSEPSSSSSSSEEEEEDNEHNNEKDEDNIPSVMKSNLEDDDDDDGITEIEPLGTIHINNNDDDKDHNNNDEDEEEEVEFVMATREDRRKRWTRCIREHLTRAASRNHISQPRPVSNTTTTPPTTTAATPPPTAATPPPTTTTTPGTPHNEGCDDNNNNNNNNSNSNNSNDNNEGTPDSTPSSAGSRRRRASNESDNSSSTTRPDNDNNINTTTDQSKETKKRLPPPPSSSSSSSQSRPLNTNHNNNNNHHRNNRLSSSSKPSLPVRKKTFYSSSMRHGGCINTAAWLSCPWRLSLASEGDYYHNHGLIFSSSYASNNSTPSMQQRHSRFYNDDDDDDNYDDDDDGRRLHLTGTQTIPQTLVVSSEECPTQLMTSGDDRLVKFWDVSGAMGSVSPMSGGYDTMTPFSSNNTTRSFTMGSPGEPSSEVLRTWKKRQHFRRVVGGGGGELLPGMVVPLASIQTGHRGNVFHATPVPGQPGKVATCAADGFLRLSDVHMQSTASSSSTASTIVISPEYDDDNNNGELSHNSMMGSLRPGMCFSHHFLDSNCGLLCSERGLRRFDLRLSPREQNCRSVFGGPYRTCKSCAIWSSSSSMGGMMDTGLESIDSAYVFAGGSSGDVALYDLRMTDSNSTRIVQHYRPRAFRFDEHVSVSGLDISKDKRELLVSYENDQIYTFPIFPTIASSAGPTIEEIAAFSSPVDDENAAESRLLPELAAYGGHLNRYTFLKSAKFAGPKDEYICTGSDSGHAWIYERATGSVVSLLNADHSTCNGVVPHPTLPVFITYGIDSTAKLWRATTPISDDVDDSGLGRMECHRKSEYVPSPLVRHWGDVQRKLNSLTDLDDDSLSILPDEVPGREDHDDDDDVFGGLAGILFRNARLGAASSGGLCIGNDLRNLPDVLQQNYFACVRAIQNGEDEPVKSGLNSLKRRISLIRLRHQADQLGLVWDPSTPWIIKPKKLVENAASGTIHKDIESHNESSNSGDKNSRLTPPRYGHPADLIPDCPSDWIPYDIEMTKKPMACGMNFNNERYFDFVLERFGMKAATCAPSNIEPCLHNDETMDETHSNTAEEEHVLWRTERPVQKVGKPWEILYETVATLKEGGNEALQQSEVLVAARRYDKAIRYCAISSMEFPDGNMSFLTPHHITLLTNGGHEVTWTPLLRCLITVRLNLSMTLLKPEIADPVGAAEQAQNALGELKPFTSERGKVLFGRKLEQTRDGEPTETYTEAIELQSKAYFRLGTAQCASGEFGNGARSFELSIKSTKNARPDGKPEAVVVRRLAEARREHSRKKKRHRKKFKFMFSNPDHEQQGESERQSQSEEVTNNEEKR